MRLYGRSHEGDHRMTTSDLQPDGNPVQTAAESTDNQQDENHLLRDCPHCGAELEKREYGVVTRYECEDCSPRPQSLFDTFRSFL